MTDIRIGKISSIDYENGMVRVTYPDKGKSVTKNLPCANFNNEYRMPEVGESALVSHLSNGSSRGVVIGTMWNKKNRPPESGKGLFRKEMSRVRGAAVQRYEDLTGRYMLKAPEIELNSGNNIEVNSQSVEVNAGKYASLATEAYEFSANKLIIGANGTGSEMKIQNKKDINIRSEDKKLEALIKSIVLKTLEKLQIESEADIKVKSGTELKLEDSSWNTNLSKIMERLEALDGDGSDKK